MILTRNISECFTRDRITCYLRELTKNKFLDIYHPDSRKSPYNIQNSLVKLILERLVDVLDEYGPIPFIDLAHVLVDELDYVDIPDIINTQYRNIVHIY